MNIFVYTFSCVGIIQLAISHDFMYGVMQNGQSSRLPLWHLALRINRFEPLVKCFFVRTVTTVLMAEEVLVPRMMAFAFTIIIPPLRLAVVLQSLDFPLSCYSFTSSMNTAPDAMSLFVYP